MRRQGSFAMSDGPCVLCASSCSWEPLGRLQPAARRNSQLAVGCGTARNPERVCSGRAPHGTEVCLLCLVVRKCPRSTCRRGQQM